MPCPKLTYKDPKAKPRLYYGARYYNPKVSNWLSVDPIALYDPVQETEHYLDGEHNGGYFNPRNMSVYGYTYQNPIIYVDPNGKQVFIGIKALINYVDNGGKYVVDNTAQAVFYYYAGNGSSVILGPKTQEGIKNHPRVQQAMKNLKTGNTDFPAEPKLSEGSDGINIDLRGVSYHLGDMGLNYQTTCTTSTCTTNFTVSDKGFVDPNYITANGLGLDDNMGPNNELGGMPYKYEPVKWSETYENPGYAVDKNGTPSIKKSDSDPVFNELCTVCE